MKSPQEVAAIIRRLKELYPDAACSLDYGKDYELLFSVRLAAQCTDARVNQVTPALFARFPTLEAFAAASPEEVGEYVRSCGFWRAKARDIVASAQMLLSDFGGRVPDNMEDLLRLPGVGRKTANLILGDVYGQAGYVCDTHCIRITGLLGLTDGSKDPLKVEQQLRACIPPEESSNFCHRMVLHGRAVCVARRPDCAGCTPAGPVRLWENRPGAVSGSKSVYNAILLCKSIAKNRMCHSLAPSGQPGMMHKTSCTEEFACFRGAPHSA